MNTATIFNHLFQGLKTGLRHSQASLNLLSEQSQSVDGIPATSDEGKPALSKAQSETTTAHDDNRPDQVRICCPPIYW